MIATIQKLLKKLKRNTLKSDVKKLQLIELLEISWRLVKESKAEMEAATKRPNNQGEFCRFGFTWDRWGKTIEHPATKIIAKSDATIRMCIKELEVKVPEKGDESDAEFRSLMRAQK